MSCPQCELRRAKLLVKTLIAVDCFDIDEVIKEMQYRWPNRFYIEYNTDDRSQTIMQRNTVAPYTPNEVYRHVHSNRNA